MALLLAKKVIVPAKYSDFADVFLKESANILPEQTKINAYTIDFIEIEQPFYGLIYRLSPVELKIFKTYIKTNLANSFILALKLLTDALILFFYKLDDSLHLFVNYQGLNNLTIKNWYPLSLIEESLDWLSQVK